MRLSVFIPARNMKDRTLSKFFDSWNGKAYNTINPNLPGPF